MSRLPPTWSQVFLNRALFLWRQNNIIWLGWSFFFSRPLQRTGQDLFLFYCRWSTTYLPYRCRAMAFSFNLLDLTSVYLFLPAENPRVSITDLMTHLLSTTIQCSNLGTETPMLLLQDHDWNQGIVIPPASPFVLHVHSTGDVPLNCWVLSSLGTVPFCVVVPIPQGVTNLIWFILLLNFKDCFFTISFRNYAKVYMTPKSDLQNKVWFFFLKAISHVSFTLSAFPHIEETIFFFYFTRWFFLWPFVLNWRKQLHISPLR